MTYVTQISLWILGTYESVSMDPSSGKYSHPSNVLKHLTLLSTSYSGDIQNR